MLTSVLCFWFCCQLEVWGEMDADLSTLILVLLPVRGVGRDGC